MIRALHSGTNANLFCSGPSCPFHFPSHFSLSARIFLTTPQTDHVSILAAERTSHVRARFDASARDPAATGAVRRPRPRPRTRLGARPMLSLAALHPQLLQTPLQHSQYISGARWVCPTLFWNVVIQGPCQSSGPAGMAERPGLAGQSAGRVSCGTRRWMPSSLRQVRGTDSTGTSESERPVSGLGSLLPGRAVEPADQQVAGAAGAVASSAPQLGQDPHPTTSNAPNKFNNFNLHLRLCPVTWCGSAGLCASA